MLRVTTACSFQFLKYRVFPNRVAFCAPIGFIFQLWVPWGVPNCFLVREKLALNKTVRNRVFSIKRYIFQNIGFFPNRVAPCAPIGFIFYMWLPWGVPNCFFGAWKTCSKQNRSKSRFFHKKIYISKYWVFSQQSRSMCTDWLHILYVGSLRGAKLFLRCVKNLL